MASSSSSSGASSSAAAGGAGAKRGPAEMARARAEEDTAVTVALRARLQETLVTNGALCAAYDLAKLQAEGIRASLQLYAGEVAALYAERTALDKAAHDARVRIAALERRNEELAREVAYQTQRCAAAERSVRRWQALGGAALTSDDEEGGETDGETASTESDD